MPVVTSDQPVAYVASKLGNQLLLDPFNFLYCRDKQVGNREYWHCVRKSSKNKPWCPGKAVTEGSFIKYTRAHNHPSDPIDVGIRQKKEKVLKMVQTHPEMKTSQALNAWAQETSAPEDRSKAVSLKSMERTVQRVKAQAQEEALEGQMRPLRYLVNALAAAVADATVGLARLVHMPNGMMFTMGM